MHLVPLYLFALYGLECSSTYMKCEFLTLDTMSINSSQNFWREMQTGCRRCNTTFYLAVHSLISSFVALLCLTIKIWWNRQFTHCINDFSKRESPSPGKIYAMTSAVNRSTGGCYLNISILNFYLSCKGSLFPLLEVTHKAIPRAFLGCLEHQFIIRRTSRLKQKHFNKGTCILAEMHARLDYLCVIKHHECPLGQILG